MRETMHKQRISLSFRSISCIFRITNGTNTILCDVLSWNLKNVADIYKTTRQRNSEARSVSTDGTASDIIYRLILLARYLSVFLPSFLLTPWSRVLLEKLTGFKLVKKNPAFYGTQKFNAAFTSARFFYHLITKKAYQTMCMLSHLTQLAMR